MCYLCLVFLFKKLRCCDVKIWLVLHTKLHCLVNDCYNRESILKELSFMLFVSSYVHSFMDSLTERKRRAGHTTHIVFHEFTWCKSHGVILNKWQALHLPVLTLAKSFHYLSFYLLFSDGNNKYYIILLFEEKLNHD